VCVFMICVTGLRVHTRVLHTALISATVHPLYRQTLYTGFTVVGMEAGCSKTGCMLGLGLLLS
jgi:hypothetical protein